VNKAGLENPPRNWCVPGQFKEKGSITLFSNMLFALIESKVQIQI
jgi:hypothetical protein